MPLTLYDLLPGKMLFLMLWLVMTSPLNTSDPLDSAAFSADPASLRQAAAAIKAEKDADVTVLFAERSFEFDAEGRELEIHHTIYRIENEDGVKGWAESSSEWEPWHQGRPEIKARVISADGSLHELDPKTLNDVPVHENSPDLYTDRRAYGGPLPAIAVGAIVEEQIFLHDTAPFFRGGSVERHVLVDPVPVHKTRVILKHPESLSLRYVLQRLPEATVSKSSVNGVETIVIENGPLPSYTQKTPFLPGDTVATPQIEFATGISWRQIAQEYASLTEEKLRPADVQPLLNKISLKGTSRDEAVRRIVTALHKSVRYTGVEFDQASLVPQFPAETLKRKYGDCKDKAALLVTILRATGISANLALLDTGPGPDVNVDLPGMGMFDHAIVYLPATDKDSEMWIDATDEYARAGTLPLADYGRWALVVDEHTTGLKKTPELTAAGNLHREVREFTLAEFGVAAITEKDEDIGPKDSDTREFYDGEPKKIREASEKYVKQAYLADSLIDLHQEDPADLQKQFSVTFVTKGKRGNTDFETAGMAIRVEDLFDGLPQFFTSPAETEKDKERDKDDEHSEKPQPRTLDWQLWPFINEWDYKILAPPGFKLRALPADKNEQLGSASFSQKYSANAEGTAVDAVLRFDSGKSRLSVAEAQALRDAVVKARNSDPIFITFDQTAHSLMAAGKIKDGLAAYHQLVQLHPKEALHRVQLARALLEAGLAEKARRVAHEAISLEPNSAQAYSTLAWILEHDLLGRRFKKGFDLDGAIAAYRKAKELTPKDTDLRANLAMLLEYDSEGTRYSSQAKLKEAVAEFRELKKMDEKAGSSYDDFVLYDLWYLQDFQGLLEAANALPATDTRRGLITAAVAAEQGPEPALAKSLEITTDEQSRRKVLTNAGWLLLRIHHYKDAAEFLAAGARSENNETQITAFATRLSRSRPAADIKIDEADPRSVIQQLFGMMLARTVDFNQVRPLFSTNALRTAETKEEREGFRRSMFQLRQQLASSSIPMDVIRDIVLNNVRYSVEGSDAVGYKVIVEIAGAEPQDAFVVREGGRYKILDYALSSSVPVDLGWQALESLNSGDLPGARQWLDWARAKVHINGGDDPLSGQPFPYFWNKGQEGDGAAIRTAALVLVPSKELKGADLDALVNSKGTLKTGIDKSRVDLVTARAFAAQQRWAELGPVAEGLLKEYSDSLTAFHLLTAAYSRGGRLDDWDRLVQDRLQKHPDEDEYLRSAAELAAYRGDYTKARDVLKGLIDRSKATQGDLNSYAWDALFLTTPITLDTLEAAERANQLSKNPNFSVMHTLACVYAQAGKPAQARELLLKAMDAGSLEEPDSAIWLALGEVAEQYGETDAARSMYARVEKPELEYPGSNYKLAQIHLQALKNGTNSTSAASGAR